MRAAFYTRQGPASEVLQVGEQPRPEPGPGEVRVKLRCSGVNPSDWKVRRGRIGERVGIWTGQWRRPPGTAAEYTALRSAQAVRLPDGVDAAAGACLGIPALTAIQAVRLAAPERGSTVLVAGGAGSVGHYAV